MAIVCASPLWLALHLRDWKSGSERDRVSLSTIRLWAVDGVLGLCVVSGGSAVVCPPAAMAQAEEAKMEELSRKVKTKVAPVYPEIARRMSITGTVKLSVVVTPNGTVKSSKAVGGHPVLVNAAMEAIKQWRFESAPTESSGIVEFKFQPQD
jgi:TonB family protein